MHKSKWLLTGLVLIGATALTSCISLFGGSQHDEFTGLNGRQVTRENFDSLIRDLDRLEGQIVEPTDKPAMLELAQIRDGFIRRLDQIKSLRVVVESSRSLTADGRGAIETGVDPDSGEFIERQSQIEFAWKGKKRKEQRKITFASWPNLIPDMGIEVFDGQKTTAFNEMNTIGGEIFKGQFRIWGDNENNENDIDVDAPCSHTEDNYLNSFHFPLLQYKTDSEDLHSSMMPVFAGGGYWQVKPQLELVDGDLCHVVAAPFSTFWFDADFVVRRCVFFWTDSNSDTTQTISTADFLKAPQKLEGRDLGTVVMLTKIEKCNGIAMPREGKWMGFSGKRYGQKLLGKALSVDTFTATELSVNDVPDSEFESPIPAGYGVQDHVRKKMYWLPKDRNRLNEAIALGVKWYPGIDAKGFVMPKPLPDKLFPDHEQFLIREQKQRREAFLKYLKPEP